MPRAIIHKKGRLAKILPPVSFITEDPNAVILTELKASRPLTRKERNFINKRFKCVVRKCSKATGGV